MLWALMVSHQHQCIFIHIPKTAGTSIEKKLGHFTQLKGGVQDHRTVQQIEPEPAKTNPLALIKTWLPPFEKDPKDPEAVTCRQFRNYFKFTFVRNPWARVYSWYLNVMEDEQHQKKHGVPADCDFHDFLTSYSGQWAMRPQTYWILNRQGKNPLDFTGRFENLREEFSFVCERLAIQNSQLPTLMMRPGARPKYVDYYDAASIDHVANRYREEIKMFSYEFGS